MIQEVYELNLARLAEIRHKLQSEGFDIDFTNENGATLVKGDDWVSPNKEQSELLTEYQTIRWRTDELTEDWDGSFIEEPNNYIDFSKSHGLFKEFKAALNLTNEHIAKITGLTSDSVKSMTQPNKDLPSWAKAMIFTWQKILK